MGLRNEQSLARDRHDPLRNAPAGAPCCWDGTGAGRLPPVPRLPGGRPAFLVSQPQPHEPWFFRPASPAPAQVKTDQSSDLSWSSDLGSDLPEICDLRNDLSRQCDCESVSSVSSVSWGDLPNCFDQVSDTSRAVISGRSDIGVRSLTPLDRTADPEPCGPQLVVSTNCSTCSTCSTCSISESGRLCRGLTLPPLRKQTGSERPALTLPRHDGKSTEWEGTGWRRRHTITGPITLAFCTSFLLALAGAIVYIEDH